MDIIVLMENALKLVLNVTPLVLLVLEKLITTVPTVLAEDSYTMVLVLKSAQSDSGIMKKSEPVNHVTKTVNLVMVLMNTNVLIVPNQDTYSKDTVKFLVIKVLMPFLIQKESVNIVMLPVKLVLEEKMMIV